MMDPAEAKKIGVSGLQQFINKLDGSKKTTVAALNGDAMGGGFELTLGCHYRVAAPAVKCSFPEVMLGILPGGQGTQRFPRLAPLELAIPMLLTGMAKAAPFLNKVGVIDLVAGADLLDVACEFALSHKPRPVSQIPISTATKVKVTGGGLEMASLQAAKAARGMIAPGAIIKCF